MRTFIVKNKFFVTLLSIAMMIILSLGIYTIQKNYKPSLKDNPTLVTPSEDKDTKKAEISALSARYDDTINGNIMTVAWNFSKNSSTVDAVYLYLNDSDPIDVTPYSNYDLPQNIYNYPTGENQVKLELQLNDGTKVVREVSVFVNYLISAKQEVVQEGSSLLLTLEYVYNEANPIKTPSTLILNSASDAYPVVTFIETQTKKNGNKITARSTYNFSWSHEASIPEKMTVRWKFNEIQISRDFTIKNPVKIEETAKE